MRYSTGPNAEVVWAYLVSHSLVRVYQYDVPGMNTRTAVLAYPDVLVLATYAAAVY